MKINELAQRLNVTARAIRLYEQKEIQSGKSVRLTASQAFSC